LKIADGVHTSDGFRPFVKLDAYGSALKAEAESWVTPDAGLEDKLLRERIRHPQLVRHLLLDKLPTHRWDILEVGGGPLPVSDLLPFRSRVVVDPCTDDYRAITPCPDHITAEIETYNGPKVDLIISTNSLDHVRSPSLALARIKQHVKPGGYVAIFCNTNNAIHHKHPSHIHNLTVKDIHHAFDDDFETVWERDDLRYGWVKVDGRRGQPAFAILLRGCVFS